MRIVLAIHNAYSDTVSGAARCARSLMEWLAAAGHECAVLSTVRFDGASPDDFYAHLASLGETPRRHPPPAAFQAYLNRQNRGTEARPLLSYDLNGVPVTVLITRHNSAAQPDRSEYEQFVFHFDQEIARRPPDLVITMGTHGVLDEVMRHARMRSAATLFWLHNRGYENREIFRHVDHVLAVSAYMQRHYREAIGLDPAVLPPVLDYGGAIARGGARDCLTFVNPSAAKGVYLFLRLADMLAVERPDIPILVIQSARDDALLRGAAGIDLSKHRQISIEPPVTRAAEFYARSKVLLMPSAFPESFGMVAAEAMLNGIPPLVSDRGNLPNTVGDGGIGLPLPDWLTPESTRVPDAADAAPWYDAVCRLWDDDAAYAAASAKARETAQALYAEASLRRRYLDYIESLAAR